MSRLGCEELEPRCLPAVMYSTGGLVVLHEASGDRGFRPFETGASSVPLFLAQDGDQVWIGAGVGGGPRLQSRSILTLLVTSDRMAGDPASRTGVSVAAFASGPSAGFPSVIPIQVDPEFPGDTHDVQSQVERLSAQLQQRLALAGTTVDVHSAPGVGLLSAWSAYRGQQTASAGDGDRTWDQVPSATMFNVVPDGRVLSSVYVRQDQASQATVYELGHAVEESLVTREHRQAWVSIWSTIRWDATYFASSEQNAFAQSFMQWVNHDPQDPRVQSWFANTPEVQ